jgi:hypothetical protein
VLRQRAGCVACVIEVCRASDAGTDSRETSAKAPINMYTRNSKHTLASGMDGQTGWAREQEDGCDQG